MRFVCGAFEAFAAGQVNAHAALGSEAAALPAADAAEAADSGEAAGESGAQAKPAAATAPLANALAAAAAGATRAAQPPTNGPACSNPPPANDPWACVDAVVALHACGSLSDCAVAFAATHCAPFLVVPCCFHKRPVAGGAAWQRELRTRRRCAAAAAAGTACPTPPANDDAAAAADSGAAAHADAHAEREAAAEAANVESTVVRLAESDAREVSFRAMATIGTLRLRACLRAAQSNNELKATQHFEEASGRTGVGSKDEGPLQLRLEAFPQAYSLRNLVLVGERLPAGGGSPGGLRGDEPRCADAHLF
jgi:hypothetical protein